MQFHQTIKLYGSYETPVVDVRIGFLPLNLYIDTDKCLVYEISKHTVCLTKQIRYSAVCSKYELSINKSIM